MGTTTVVHRFTSEDEKKEFIALIQNRKVVLTKVTVLKELLGAEVEDLEKIKGQLLLFYKINPARRYYIDQKSQTLFEATEGKKEGNERSEDKAVHTFKSDEDFQKFNALNNGQVNALTKISVIESYIGQEQQELDQFNGLLLFKFQVSPSKFYNLDSGKKGIVELLGKSELIP